MRSRIGQNFDGRPPIHLHAKASVIGKNSAEGQTFSVDLIVGFR